jgi:hypothetical protein
MNDQQKTGSDGMHRASRKVSPDVDPSAPRGRFAGAIGRAAIWGLLPIPFAERLIRWARLA